MPVVSADGGGTRPRTAKEEHEDLLVWFKSELKVEGAVGGGGERGGDDTEEWDEGDGLIVDDDGEDGEGVGGVDGEWGGVGGGGLILDAMLGPSNAGIGGGRTDVGWRVMTPQRGSRSKQEWGNDDEEEESEEEEEEEEEEGGVDDAGASGGAGDDSFEFEVVHVKESLHSSPRDGGESDDAADGGEEEESLLVQRVRLLASALQDARSALVMALGEDDFLNLCDEVLKAAESEEEGLEWRPTKADPDGRYMVQVYHYIYLQEELSRCEARVQALAAA